MTKWSGAVVEMTRGGAGNLFYYSVPASQSLTIAARSRKSTKLSPVAGAISADGVAGVCRHWSLR